MNVYIKPSIPEGIIKAPVSKSAMQRSCAAALIKGGITRLHNPGNSNDDLAALRIIQQLGARVQNTNGILEIHSNGINPPGNGIHCSESGLSARLFTSIASLSNKNISITGEGSLLNRPFDFFDNIFPLLNVEVKTSRGLLPVHIKGPLQPADIEIDGSLSSQFLSGLLMAYAAAGASDKTIYVKDLKSKPYVDLTLRVMEDFGLNTPIHRDYNSFYFGRQSISGFSNDEITYSVEGDWSGAAFLLVAGAIAGKITVKGLDALSVQADRKISEALVQSGANISIQAEEVSTRKSKLKAFQFDATHCPDLFPPLVALAAYCKGTSVIEGVNRLKYKESNRAETLQQEFGKMGVQIELQDDLMIIRNVGMVNGALVDSHHDHRIAMACAVAALDAKGETIISGAESVNKSYPSFWDHLKKLNAGLSLENKL